MPKVRPVCQYTRNGKYVKTFPSIAAAAREMGVTGSSISQCCRDEIPYCKGFSWKYEDKAHGKSVIPVSCGSELFNHTEVQQFDATGKLIATFPSVEAAALVTRLHPMKIVDMAAFPEKRRYGLASKYTFKIKEG